MTTEYTSEAEARGIEIRYGTTAVRLLQDKRGRVTGVLVRGPAGFEELSAKAVILATGGIGKARGARLPVPSRAMRAPASGFMGNIGHGNGARSRIWRRGMQRL